jgi:hypothetical protein
MRKAANGTKCRAATPAWKFIWTWMIVEPFASDLMADNLNPIGRIFYSASTQICVPASLSQEVGLALGTR